MSLVDKSDSDDDTWNSSASEDDFTAGSSDTLSSVDGGKPDSFTESDIEEFIIPLMNNETPWADLDNREKNDVIDFLIEDVGNWNVKQELVGKIAEELLIFRDRRTGESILHRLTSSKLLLLIMENQNNEQQIKFVTSKDMYGRTPIHAGCKRGNSDVVEILLNMVTDKDDLVLSSTGKFGTALHEARCAEIVFILVNSLQEVNREKLMFTVNDVGETALHHACRHGRTNVVNALLHSTKNDCLAKLLLATNSNGETALHCAAKKGHDLVVGCLISFGSDCLSEMAFTVSKADHHGYGGTPLHLAGNQQVAHSILCQLSKNERNKLLDLVNNDGETVLHTASEKGLDKVAEYILSVVENHEDMIFFQCSQGDTPLHKASNSAVAATILNSIEKPLWEEVMLKRNKYNETFLHCACSHYEVELVEFYLNLDIDKKSLIFLVSSGGMNDGTALHQAHDENIAHALLCSLDKELQKKLVFAPNQYNETALHVACRTGNLDLVSYLLTTDVNICELIFMPSKPRKNRAYGTALAVVADADVAELLLDALDDADSERLLFQLNEEGVSPLHWAVVAENGGIFDLVKFYLSVVKEKQRLLFIASPKHGSVLHVATGYEITDLLLQNVDADEVEKFVLLTNDNLETAFHTTCKTGDNEVLCCLLQRLSAIPVSTIFPDPNVEEDSLSERVDLPAEWNTYELTQVKPQNMCELIMITPNKDGNIPLMLAINSGSTSLVDFILRFVEHETQIKPTTLLEYQNKAWQNSFHLASRHKDSELFGFDEYISEVDQSSIMTRDKLGNSPILYVAGMSNIKFFAQLIMSVPLGMRRLMMKERNINHINLQSITDRPTDRDDIKFLLNSIHNDFSSKTIKSFYSQFMSSYFIMSDKRNVIKPDPRLMTIMMYATLNYSLLDSVDLSASSSPQNQQGTGYIFFDELTAGNQMTHGKMKAALWNLDCPERHGQPKIVVRRRLSKSSMLTPPGPDFLIIDIVVKDVTDCSQGWMNQLAHIGSQAQLVEKLKSDEDILHISVNSTQGKHLPDENCAKLDTLEQHRFHQTSKDVTGQGRALIFCIKEDREDWRTQFDYAHYVLQHQLGLNVATHYDFDEEAILREIQSFANRNDHGHIMVILILAHGDLDGDISCVGDETVSVQAVVDSMCTKMTQSLPKLLMLSFCRGGIRPAFNRVTQGFESRELPDLVNTPSFSPVKQKLPSKQRFKEYQTHPFPGVEVPPDCYVLFTTLPDSKSPRDNSTFKEMMNYFTDKISIGLKANNTINTEQATLPSPPSSSQESPPVQTSKDQGQSAVEQNQLSCTDSTATIGAHVELIDMLTDLAGVVREKSRFCIYPNYCYTVNSKSKPVVLSLFNCHCSKQESPNDDLENQDEDANE